MESIFIGDSTNPLLEGELLFFGFPPCLPPTLLYGDPFTDNDRDDVADAPVGGAPLEAVDDVVGVIDIKFRGGGCIGRGRDKGKDNGVEEDGLKPL